MRRLLVVIVTICALAFAWMFVARDRAVLEPAGVTSAESESTEAAATPEGAHGSVSPEQLRELADRDARLCRRERSGAGARWGHAS